MVTGEDLAFEEVSRSLVESFDWNHWVGLIKEPIQEAASPQVGLKRMRGAEARVVRQAPEFELFRREATGWVLHEAEGRWRR
jgi:hypothetical protein